MVHENNFIIKHTVTNAWCGTGKQLDKTILGKIALHMKQLHDAVKCNNCSRQNLNKSIRHSNKLINLLPEPFSPEVWSFTFLADDWSCTRVAVEDRNNTR